MGFGDITSIVFIVVILASLFWPFVRERGRQRRNLPTGTPRDFAHSGGYARVTPQRQSGSLSSSPLSGHETEEALHRLRVEERLTREELAVRDSSRESDVSGTTRSAPRQAKMSQQTSSASPSGNSIRLRLSTPASAQEAFIIKEVFDRPVGMRNDI